MIRLPAYSSLFNHARIVQTALLTTGFACASALLSPAQAFTFTTDPVTITGTGVGQSSTVDWYLPAGDTLTTPMSFTEEFPVNSFSRSNLQLGVNNTGIILPASFYPHVLGHREL